MNHAQRNKNIRMVSKLLGEGIDVKFLELRRFGDYFRVLTHLDHHHFFKKTGKTL